MSIDTFLQYISKEKRYSRHTVVNYNKDLLDFERYCIEEFSVSLLEVNSKMVRSWFATLIENQNDPRTVRRKSSSLKSYFKYMIKLGEAKSSPVEGVPLPKLSKKLPKYVEEKKMDLLLDFMFEEESVGLMERLVIEMFYHTGIRLSELINIKKGDVSLFDKSIKVIGKRNKERIIPFSDALGETIQKYLSYRNEEGGYLFVTEKGEKTYPKLIYRIVQRYLEKVTTLTKKSPHVLRHTFATHMLNNGAELNAIKEILGHANLSATEVYTHNSLEKIKSVYKQAHPRA